MNIIYKKLIKLAWISLAKLTKIIFDKLQISQK